MILNIAHRGASAQCPENTLAAFRRAIDLGADYLELDLRFSKDGGMVIIHDETVERTMSGRGAVSRMSLVELDRLTSASSVESGFHKERIPILAKVVQLAQTNLVGLLVEIKPVQHLPETFLKDLCRLLSSSKLGSRVILQSFDLCDPGDAENPEVFHSHSPLVGSSFCPPSASSFGVGKSDRECESEVAPRRFGL